MIKNKKSQFEILGLAIVIILITLGILFVIRFVVLKEPSKLRYDYTRTEMASNMLNTLLRTDTDCKRKSMTELFQDCASYNRIECEYDGIPMNSCEYLNYTSSVPSSIHATSSKSIFHFVKVLFVISSIV
jgi:hypothetical protein